MRTESRERSASPSIRRTSNQRASSTASSHLSVDITQDLLDAGNHEDEDDEAGAFDGDTAQAAISSIRTHKGVAMKIKSEGEFVSKSSVKVRCLCLLNPC